MTQGMKHRRRMERRKKRIEFWKDIAFAFALGAGGTAVIVIWILLS